MDRAIERADLAPLLEDLRQRPWQVLHRLSAHLIARSTDPGDLRRSLTGVLTAILAATRGDRAVVLLRDDDGRLEAVASHGIEGAAQDDRISWTVVQRVFAAGAGVFVPRIEADAEMSAAASVEEMEIRSALCVPLETGLGEGLRPAEERRRHPAASSPWSEVLGILYVDSLEPREPYAESDLDLLRALSNILATALQNHRLQREATTDPTSGLTTRRHLEVVLRHLERLRKADGPPYGVLLGAIDRDGPVRLEGVGRLLAGVLRRTDTVARHGARRIALVLPSAGPAEVAAVGRRVLAAVEGLRLGASAVPEPAADARRAVEMADQALAAARGEGRRLVSWTPEVASVEQPTDRLADLVSADEGADYARLEDLVETVDRLRGPGELLGQAPALLEALERLRKAAPTRATVLVTGESGTGKELLARRLHALGDRPGGPFVVVDCGAIPDRLLESELFGHEAGAFTGATERHVGKCQRADGGTLFLDEVGEIPPALQPKLLRFLQERDLEPVGGTGRIAVDVRVVAATHRDLAADVEAGRFRRDLYHRLDVVSIVVPPLRERGRDLLALAQHFLETHARRHRRPLVGFDEDALDALAAHDWPGNVRELQNAIEQAVLLAEDERLTAADLGLPGLEVPTFETFAEARRLAIEAFEGDYLRRMLDLAGGDLTACARRIGLSERRFRELRRKYGID